MRARYAIAALAISMSAVALSPRAARADEVQERIAHNQQDFIDAHGDKPIVGVRIEGLKRTRPAVVNQWITCPVGTPLSTCSLAEIRDRIYRLGIFAEVEITLNDRPDGAEIVFTIDEKWTLYPVPMLWYSPGTEMAGVVLVEANVLGYNKGAALGGVYSNRGWYLVGGYNDPNIGFTPLWGQLHVFYGSVLVENDDREGNIEQSFDMKRFDAEYQIGWTLWDRISPTWTGSFRTAKIGDVHVVGAEPAADATTAQQGFLIIYSDRRFRELYDAGLRVSAEVQHAFPLDKVTRPYNDAIFDIHYDTAAPLHGFWDLRGRAFLGNMPIAFEERLGGVDNSRTIPGSGFVGVDRYANAAIAYQVPLFSVKPGTMAAQVFGEIGRYKRNDEESVNYGGPGVGLRFYLKQIAIPAVGMDLGYEVGSKRFAFSVAVGYRPLR